MTAPNVASPRDSILANIEKLRKAGMEADIPTYLREIEGVNPDDYMQPAGGLGRTLGLGARGMVQGLGNLAGLPFTMAGAGYQAVTGNQPPQILQPQGGAAADQMGLPTPQTPGERIGVAGTEGVAASLPFMGAGAIGPVAGTMLGGGAGMAGQGAAEAGAGPLGQMAASMAVGIGLPVVGAMGAATIRSAVAGSAARREAARQSMALLQAGDPNGPVTLGQVAQGGMARSVEGGLRNVPGASSRFQGTLERQADAMGQRATRLADQISPAGSPTSAGAAIQRGISEGFVPKFRAQSKALYDKVFQLVPGDTPVIPGKTVGLFAEQGNLAAQARPLSDELFANGKMGAWSEKLAATLEASPQGVPFNVLKEWRSQLGEMLSGADLVEGISLRDVKRLYGTLSDDMKTAVASKGPDAVKAWDRAQLHWQAGTDRLERILQPLMDKNVPERAFSAVMSGSRDGASVLRSTLRSLRGEERRLVASTVLRRMGHANPGSQNAAGDVFGPETFLTNWNKLAAESKGALFEGIDPSLPKDLNALAKAIELRKTAGRTLYNPSGTSPNTAFWSIVTGLPVALAGVATGSTPMMLAGAAPATAAGAADLTAKVFTNPNMIRWLVRQTKVPMGALTQELAILAKDSERWDPESRDVAQELAQTLSHIDWRSVLMATAVADQSRTH